MGFAVTGPGWSGRYRGHAQAEQVFADARCPTISRCRKTRGLPVGSVSSSSAPGCDRGSRRLEPRNLHRLKAAIRDRWDTVLLDMLTETALRTGCLDAFAPVGNRSEIAATNLFQRLLLLAIYAYGTNTGIRRWPPASTGTARTSCATPGAAT